MAPTAAQEEFNDLLDKNNSNHDSRHPEDRHEASDHELSEDETFRNAQVNAAMRTMPANSMTELQLPPATFDNGCTTGVKGVIADARSFETARRQNWKDRARTARNSILGFAGVQSANLSSNIHHKSESETDDDAKSDNPDEEAFLQQWRESRRRELEMEANRAIRTRRTSPSVRSYGRLDEVDALGYLDAIEKVGRDTKVVVFVYDGECEVSTTIESALQPLVRANMAVHFVKVHYEEIEFDPAAVPAILAYRNQGDLFANLTGIIELMPEDDNFGAHSLGGIFQKHGIL